MQRNADRSADEGFTLVEVLVSLAIISVVMTAVAGFLIDSTRTSQQQSVRDTAVQIAVQGMENARGVRGSALLSGRTACDASHACDAPVSATVNGLLGAGPQRWDASGAGPLVAPRPGVQPDGSVVSGPNQPEVVVLGGLTFKRYYYVAKCWQSAAVNGAATPRPCTVALASAAFPAAFLRLVVAITWPGEECSAGRCSFATASLLSASPTDPYLAGSLPLPPLTYPGDQIGRTGVAVTPLTVAGATGQVPLTWSATDLPNGLTINSSTGAISGTPKTVAAYTVGVKITDVLGRTASTTFIWTILPPILTTPADQLTPIGTAVALQVVATGGVPSLVWSATGLPVGVTINSSTGLISGAPTTAQASTLVTVRIVDKSTPAASAVATFNWRVVTLPKIVSVPAQTFANGVGSNNFDLSATGGTGSYVWQGFNLPDGLTIDRATGTIYGTVQSGSRYISTITATDTAGGVGSLTVVCTVTPSSGTDLQVSIPAPINGPSTTVNNFVSLTPIAKGGAKLFTWAATGLPPGVTVDAAGVMSGRPTTVGSYTVALTVTRTDGSEKAVVMFVWTVTP